MTTRFDYAALGQMLKNCRERHNLSIGDVEQEFGLSGTFLNDLEAGEIREIAIEPMLLLRQLYGFSFDDLLQFDLGSKMELESMRA